MQLVLLEQLPEAIRGQLQQRNKQRYPVPLGATTCKSFELP